MNNSMKMMEEVRKPGVPSTLETQLGCIAEGIQQLADVCKSQQDMVQYLLGFSSGSHLENRTNSVQNDSLPEISERSFDIMAKEHRIRVVVGHDEEGNEIIKRLSATDELKLADKVIEAVVKSGRIKDFIDQEIEYGPHEKRAQEEGDFLYAVPGSPLVAERTVVLLREMAKDTSVEVEILPGMSFVEVMYTRLGIDPIEGLTIIDAEDVEKLKERPLQSLVVSQVYNRQIASDTKLALMELYGDEYEGLYIHNLALPDESLRRIPLYELDRQPDIDHLTTFFVPREPFFVEKP